METIVATVAAFAIVIGLGFLSMFGNERGRY